ncbi:MAG TPA: DUF3131 domain-containing protein [Longimicrobiales bacterium]|nr:DUF3131 domain-containing protein [Longimicrobiales bacterium]
MIRRALLITTLICVPLCAEAQSARTDSVLHEAARAAWRFADRNYVSSTGLTRPFDSYQVGTMWDIASGLAAIYCARQLEFINQPTYEARMRTALRTLGNIPLFDEKYFNKEYNTQTAAMIGLTRRPSRQGYGASSIDVGRLLIWLHIIRRGDRTFENDVKRIVARIELDDYISGGYLRGRQISRRTGRIRPFQEGRIGYEQYSAQGFAYFGKNAERALDITENEREKEVEGVTVASDKRGGDRLTSEPFVLSGLEFGWNRAMQERATAVLTAQHRRFARTRIPTAVSEDAINIPPDYFFYFGVLTRHGPWTIDVQRPGVQLKSPRWTSTKAAFGWYALHPNQYTEMLANYVATRAKTGNTIGSGVFENGRSTGNPNINTAAGILEAALYRKLGHSLN